MNIEHFDHFFTSLVYIVGRCTKLHKIPRVGNRHSSFKIFTWWKQQQTTTTNSLPFPESLIDFFFFFFKRISILFILFCASCPPRCLFCFVFSPPVFFRSTRFSVWSYSFLFVFLFACVRVLLAARSQWIHRRTHSHVSFCQPKKNKKNKQTKLLCIVPGRGEFDIRKKKSRSKY
jgi:hypothetical protein